MDGLNSFPELVFILPDINNHNSLPELVFILRDKNNHKFVHTITALDCSNVHSPVQLT
jgi:hypothetical protein